MKYQRTDAFKADYSRLSERERDLFRQAVRELNAAFRPGQPPRFVWPAHLRVKSVVGAPGVFEMTWSFSGPDGRATFEIVDLGGEPAIRWRRIGTHAIFREP